MTGSLYSVCWSYITHIIFIKCVYHLYIGRFTVNWSAWVTTHRVCLYWGGQVAMTVGKLPPSSQYEKRGKNESGPISAEPVNPRLPSPLCCLAEGRSSGRVRRRLRGRTEGSRGSVVHRARPHVGGAKGYPGPPRRWAPSTARRCVRLSRRPS